MYESTRNPRSAEIYLRSFFVFVSFLVRFFRKPDTIKSCPVPSLQEFFFPVPFDFFFLPLLSSSLAELSFLFQSFDIAETRSWSMVPGQAG